MTKVNWKGEYPKDHPFYKEGWSIAIQPPKEKESRRRALGRKSRRVRSKPKALIPTRPHLMLLLLVPESASEHRRLVRTLPITNRDLSPMPKTNSCAWGLEDDFRTLLASGDDPRTISGLAESSAIES
jgi:hypothetical protein